MKETIYILADIVNEFHDIFIYMAKKLGLHLTDKELHFWIIGIIGIITFVFVHMFFKFIAKYKWSVATFSFIYTFTIMLVLVFAIEIQQAVTNKGNMEFEDAVMGLWGFLAFFAVYALVAIAVYNLFYKRKRKSK